MENLQNGSLAAAGDLKKELAEIRLKVDKAASVIPLEALEEKWVENHSGGILHMVRDATHTHCGLLFAISRGAILRDTLDPLARLCSSCVKCRGLLL
jgi:hypothetical protein